MGFVYSFLFCAVIITVMHLTGAIDNWKCVTCEDEYADVLD